jgi:hypothetical protein
MHILSKHRELLKQINIHEIAENFRRNLASNPLFIIIIIIKKQKTKTTKTCLKEKEDMSRQSM